MEMIALLLMWLPTLFLLWLVGGYQRRSPRLRALWVCVGLGMAASLPVWLVESAIDASARGVLNPYLKIFIGDVLSAAITEELLLFLAFCVGYVLLRGSARLGPADIVAMAVSVAIGFTTVENTIDVLAAPDRLSMAIDRLMSVVAGHAVLQLVMGYFAALVLLGEGSRVRHAVLMLAAPIALHGWGDYTETLFQYEESLYPDAEASKLLFSAWILGLFAYVGSGVAVLWQIRSKWKTTHAPGEPGR